MEKENSDLGSFLLGAVVGCTLVYYLVKNCLNNNNKDLESKQKENSELEKIRKIADSVLENKK